MASRSCRNRRGFESCRSPVGTSLFLYYTLSSDVLVSVKKSWAGTSVSYETHFLGVVGGGGGCSGATG